MKFLRNLKEAFLPAIPPSAAEEKEKRRDYRPIVLREKDVDRMRAEVLKYKF